MSCPSIMFSLFLISPCTESGGESINEAVAAALSNPNRPAEDAVKDEGRKPAEVLTFFNIKPGMTVLDLFSGGGYYTELLNSVVGKDGKSSHTPTRLIFPSLVKSIKNGMSITAWRKPRPSSQKRMTWNLRTTRWMLQCWC